MTTDNRPRPVQRAEGLRIRFKQGSRPAEVLEEVGQKATMVGPSNIFLIRGSDPAKAVLSTSMAIGGSHRADITIPAGDQGRSIWVVAYFGTSSSTPVVWEVVSVEQAGRRIRVSFSETKEGDFTADREPYLAWAPLGELEYDTYTLELFDTVAKQVVLTRLVRHDR